jgi:ABC-type sugar transport system ATPase subunit
MIEIAAVSKRYANTVALADLSLQLRRGAITGIVGPNGAGKSTLMRLIAGEETADDGAFHLDGKRWRPEHEHRVGIVHQDPALWGNLTVGENLLVGREPTRFARPRPGAAEREILDRLTLGRHLQRRVGELSLAMQQRVEIARALAREADIFLFDEPNSALTIAESQYMFQRMRALADEGKVVILVSHRLDEVADNCDEIALIRNGRLAARLSGTVTAQALAEQLTEGSHPSGTVRGAGTNSRDGLTLSGWVGDAFAVGEFRAPAGEVTAIIGVEGSGARPFLMSLAGLAPASGRVSLLGRGGDDAVLRGRALYIAGDRRQTVFAHMSVAENLVMRQRLSATPRRGVFLNRAGLQRVAEDMRRRHNIKCRAVSDLASTLSGGNQQKVVIASAMAASPDVLLIEEPTRGVDIGSRREIYEQLRVFAAEGRVVIALCTEETEVFELADRALVFDRGDVIAAVRPGDYADAEGLAGAIAGAITAARRQPRH